ncbi:MAG: hypothetical protein Q8N12_08470 [Thermodesulfovibrionales bacterium]|nr:hypothetical protein [Nitrospinota bacterium]MDP3049443.1 hypothetical protein [Thermodesulfovibrionales bacterium]
MIKYIHGKKVYPHLYRTGKVKGKTAASVALAIRARSRSLKEKMLKVGMSGK